jgi:hypothetical protein
VSLFVERSGADKSAPEELYRSPAAAECAVGIADYGPPKVRNRV